MTSEPVVLTWDTQHVLAHIPELEIRDALVYALSCTSTGVEPPAYHMRDNLSWINLAFMTQPVPSSGPYDLLFPAGLIYRATAALEHLGCPVEVNRAWHVGPSLRLSESLLAPTPRPHQIGVPERLIQFVRACRQAAPRSGKTWEIFMTVAKLGLRALVLTHETEWADQLYGDFCKIAGDQAHMVGRWFGGKKEPGELTVAGASALNASLRAKGTKAQDYLATVGCLIVDEGDFIGGTNMAHKIARHCINAPYAFGFSATFTQGRADGASMAVEALCGPLAAVSDSVEAEELGFHAEGKATFVRMPRFRVSIGTEWREEYDTFLLKNAYRNLAIAYLAHRAVTTHGWTTLVLTHEISQALELSHMLPGATVVTGKTAKGKRKQIFDDFLAGTRKLVITTLYKRAVNVPELDCCILAGGGRSAARFIQSVYRPKTASETRTKVSHLVDFLDNTWSGGRKGRLTRHSEERLRLLERDGGWEITQVDLHQLAGFRTLLFSIHPNGIVSPAVDEPEGIWTPGRE